jgi:hypothetical protein
MDRVWGAAFRRVGFVQRFVVAGPYRYIREAMPLVARVLSLIKAPTLIVEGHPTTYAILAKIEFRNPDSGQLQTADAKSTDFASSVRSEYTTSFKVGDYVTAVYFHGDFAKSLQIYSFLDLMPDVGLVRRNDRQTQWGYVWKIPGLILIVIGFLGILFWDIIAFGRYEPLNFGFSQGLIPFAAGAVVLGGGLIGGIWLARQKEARRRDAWNAAALAVGEERGSRLGRSSCCWLSEERSLAVARPCAGVSRPTRSSIVLPPGINRCRSPKCWSPRTTFCFANTRSGSRSRVRTNPIVS